MDQDPVLVQFVERVARDMITAVDDQSGISNIGKAPSRNAAAISGSDD